MNDRTKYGFPVIDPIEIKRAAARPIAAAAKLRNAQAIQCNHCLAAEKLAMVQRITNNWNTLTTRKKS